MELEILLEPDLAFKRRVHPTLWGGAMPVMLAQIPEIGGSSFHTTVMGLRNSKSTKFRYLEIKMKIGFVEF
jgi:hypothetical protein